VNNLVVIPVLIPLLSAALSVLAHRWQRAQAVIGVLGAGALLASALQLGHAVLTHGVLALKIGSWPAPFGITLVADTLGAVMVVLGGVTGFAVAIYALADIDATRRRAGFFPLLHVLLMGVCCSFLTGDIFNLYVCFEVMLIASFVLLALGGERPQMEGALKYVTLNLVSSAIFLAAVGVLYGLAGTLNMAHLAQIVPTLAKTHPYLVAAVAGLFLVSFGIKAGIFPLYFWLPASYHTPPVAVSAVFAGLLTKVGVYALIRVFTLVFASLDEVYYKGLLILSACTMLTGVLGAVSQYHIRRILSFHIISQIGYMVMGLGLLASPDPAVHRLGLLAAVFYIAHHIIVKTNLFFIGGVVRRLRGTEQLNQMGGLYRQAPWLAALFAVPALSLAGIPPLSGFWAKLAMIRAGLQAGQWLVVAAALAAGVMTLLSMVKIWNEAFWKAQPENTAPAGGAAAVGDATKSTPEDGKVSKSEPPRVHLVLLVAPAVALALLTLLIGLFPGALFELAGKAAGELLNPAPYLEAVSLAVTGGTPP
jgi:multicomponent Na+:H+ antiporter subunit D